MEKEELEQVNAFRAQQVDCSEDDHKPLQESPGKRFLKYGKNKRGLLGLRHVCRPGRRPSGLHRSPVSRTPDRPRGQLVAGPREEIAAGSVCLRREWGYSFDVPSPTVVSNAMR